MSLFNKKRNAHVRIFHMTTQKQTITEHKLSAYVKNYLIKESHGRLNEDGGDIAKDFINWAYNEAEKMRRLGGPINAVELMYEYYTENNEEALNSLVEVYCEARNIGEDQYENVKQEVVRAVNAWGYYNAGDIGPDTYAESVIREAVGIAWRNFISENIGRINEGVYGYPDAADQILLASENDRECYNIYSQIARMVAKKAKSGVEISADYLANSSAMKKLQQFAFRKFKNIQNNFDPKLSPAVYRKHTADVMVDEVRNGQWD